MTVIFVTQLLLFLNPADGSHHSRRVLHEELKAASSSAAVAGPVGASVGKALRLLAERAEYMASAGPELRQVCLVWLA